MNTTIEELVKECKDLEYTLGWKNTLELHETFLEFFMDELSWTLANIESEDNEVTVYYAQRLRIQHTLAKAYCKRHKIAIESVPTKE